MGLRNYTFTLFGNEREGGGGGREREGGGERESTLNGALSKKILF